MRRVRTICVLLVLFIATPLPGLVQMVAVRRRSALAYRIPVIYHKIVCRLLDVRITTIGEPVTPGPCLLASNHISWLDIPVLSALFPACFIAKSEIDNWPIFGWLARMQQTLFVSRERRSATAKFNQAMQRRFAAGEHLVLFPEGTSSDGNRVLPFKTALFGAIKTGADRSDEDITVPIQPVSIAYTKFHGLPMGRDIRPTFAWYGDMEIVPHLWRALCSGPCDVTVQFHNLLDIKQFENRKQLARYSEQTVRRGMLAALTGRDVPHKFEAPEE